MGDMFKGPKIKGQKRAAKQAAESNKLANEYIRNLTNAGNLSAGGLSGVTEDGTTTVTSDPLRERLVNRLSATLNRGGREYRDLRELVSPGFSKLRESQLRQVENARARTVSDLQNDLRNRGVAGSSFASDTRTRTELSFLEEKERIEAVTFIQEMEMTSNFVDKQYQFETAAFEAKLNELNIQADLGLKLAGVGADLMKAQAQLQTELAAYNGKFRADMAIAQAKLDAQAQAGAGSLIGKGLGAAAGLALAPATGGASLLAIPGALAG